MKRFLQQGFGVLSGKTVRMTRSAWVAGSMALSSALLSSMAVLPSVGLAQAEEAAYVLDGYDAGDNILPFGVGGRTIRFYAADVDWKAFLVLSPGGKIDPTGYSDLAKQAAQQGFVVAVVRYFQNVAAIPVIPNNQNRAVLVGRQLKQELSRLRDVPPVLIERGADQLPVYGLGHSLGGAALGSFGPEASDVFDAIALYGTSVLIKDPSAVSVPVSLIVGEQDGLLASEEKKAELERLEGLFSTEIVSYPKANHFCIGNEGVGDSEFRDQDKATPLSLPECQSGLVDILVDLWDL